MISCRDPKNLPAVREPTAPAAKTTKGAVRIMQGAMIVGIVFSGVIMALVIIGGTILMAIRLFKGGANGGDNRARTEETRMIQEIYKGLARMEQRVDALETILLEKEKKDHRL
jgi:phage shock protein B